MTEVTKNKIEEWVAHEGFTYTQRVFFAYLLRSHWTLGELCELLQAKRPTVVKARQVLLKREVLDRKCDEQGNWHYYA